MCTVLPPSICFFFCLFFNFVVRIICRPLLSTTTWLHKALLFTTGQYSVAQQISRPYSSGLNETLCLLIHNFLLPPTSIPCQQLFYMCFFWDWFVFYVIECLVYCCQKRHQLPRNWSCRCWWALCGFWELELILGHLQEQIVLSTTESSSQPKLFILMLWFLTFGIPLNWHATMFALF